MAEQGRPVVMEEVDEETFDVGAVLILDEETQRYSFIKRCQTILTVYSF